MTSKRNAAERLADTMPTLEHLDMSLRGKRMIGNIMGIHGPPEPRAKQIADGYVRLVEKTIIDYQEARNKLFLFMAGGGEFDNYCRAQDFIESSVQSLHRAILYLDKLRRFGFCGADGSPFVPKPRELTVLRDKVKARVRKLRDACEHLDEDIIDGKISPNSDVAIHLGYKAVDLYGITISYVDLAKWMEQLHHFALLLSCVQITVGKPPKSTEGAPSA